METIVHFNPEYTFDNIMGDIKKKGQYKINIPTQPINDNGIVYFIATKSEVVNIFRFASKENADSFIAGLHAVFLKAGYISNTEVIEIINTTLKLVY